jgi:hypothetical protein
VAGDLDPNREPAETDEPPMIAVHAYLDTTVISHTVAVGAAATRSPISGNAPDFVNWARAHRSTRTSPFDHPTIP